jgi:hypothetical protein
MTLPLNQILRAVIFSLSTFMLLAGWLSITAYGQYELPCSGAYKYKVIAQGENSVATGELKVKTYRLEGPDKDMFCLNVSLDSPTFLMYLIWINDDPRAAYKTKDGGITTAFPLEWLEDGASVSVSLSDKPYDRTTLPEKLQLPKSLVRSGQANTGNRSNGVAIRRVIRNVKGVPTSFIEVVLGSMNTTVMNQMWVIQIGRQEFWVENVSGMSCTMTPEQFAQLADGDPIRLSLGKGALRNGTAGRSLGRLDKSVLDK